MASASIMDEGSALQEITDVLRSGRKRTKICEELLSDVRSFQLGHKPGAWLVDLCDLDVTKISALIKLFKKGKSLKPAKAFRLNHENGTDLLFCRALTLNDRVTVVDISKKLTEPQILDRNDFLRKMFEEIKGALNSTSEEEPIHTLNCLDSWNVTTVFGLFLNYPVIYWYEGEDNCLSNTDLVVVKVENVSNSRAVTQFSYPAKLRDDIEPFLGGWFSENFQEKEFRMSSQMVNQPYYAL